MKPLWIVNDLGELGVKVGTRFFFLYKGDNIEYGERAHKDGVALHDDGTPMQYRIVGKREFGETCQPLERFRSRWPGRYQEPVVFTPGLSFGKPEDGEWRPLPAAPAEGGTMTKEAQPSSTAATGETPRTDAVMRGWASDDNRADLLENLARQLERELAEAKRDVNTLNETLRQAGWGQGEIDHTAAMVQEEIEARATRSATRDTLGIEHVIAIVTRLIEDVAEDPTRLARAQELARRDILPLLATRPEIESIPEGCTPTDAKVLREANGKFAEENHQLRRALRFYANGMHYRGLLHWEGPSGDDNWLCPPSDSDIPHFAEERREFVAKLDEAMVEDGSIARSTLRGKYLEAEDAEDEPKVVRGEPEWEIAKWEIEQLAIRAEGGERHGG